MTPQDTEGCQCLKYEEWPDELEAAFWKAVAKAGGTRVVWAEFPDSTWHQVAMVGATVYLDGTVLPRHGAGAIWERDLTGDEIRALYEAGEP